MANKTQLLLSIHIAKDSSGIDRYTQEEIISKLKLNEVSLHSNKNGTIFLQDTKRTNKIMGVIEIK